MAGNNNTAVATRQDQSVAPSAFEKAIMFGDISGLNERGRMDYIGELCKSLGMNPLGRGFEYINFGGGKLTCYLTAMGASQLRMIHKVSITKVDDHGIVNGFYRITVYGGTPNGRMDIEFGSVYALDKDNKPFVGLALENVRKKTFTQSKSRLTKSLVGLAGMPSEDEKDDYGKDWGASVAGSVPMADNTDPDTGEVDETKAPITPQLTAKLVDYTTRIRKTYGDEAGNLPTVEEFKTFTIAEAKELIAELITFGADLKAKRDSAQTAQEPIEELAGV